MRRIVGLLSIAALAASAAPAAAAPPGNGLITQGPFSCAGVETTIVHSAGNSAYIGDQHYVLASTSSTPTGGATQTLTFGQKEGLSGSLTCTQVFPERTLTVVLLPVAPEA